MDETSQLLLISGSLRDHSSNTALLATAAAVAPGGITASFYNGVAGLPQFNPDHDGPRLPEPAADLRAQIRAADAVLFSTPEYAGALPGSFKNLLDWAVGDDRPGSLNGKPVAWINVSPRGAALAHASLRHVVGYLGAHIVEEACVDIPVTRDVVGDDGLIGSADIRRQLVAALTTLMASVLPRRGSSKPS
jgi:chromate reductase, NAD(P)H dehydrogenase (quinone)